MTLPLPSLDSEDRRLRPIELQGIERRRRILLFIWTFRYQHLLAPDLQEIADAVELRQAHTVRMHLFRLRGDGLVSFESGRPRSVQLTDRGLAYVTSLGGR